MAKILSFPAASSIGVDRTSGARDLAVYVLDLKSLEG
jgi:hypothetical protein